MSIAQVKISNLVWFTVIALALIALTTTIQLPLRDMVSDASASTARSPSDTGGQTASPNPSSGFDQEEKVRQLLAKQYEQRYGASDEAIRAALNIKGKVADFVGYDAKQNRWLVAESKASNIHSAYDQLANTTKGLLAKHPGAHIEAKLFLDRNTFELLKNHGQSFGWRMNAQGYLGWKEGEQWFDAVVEGIKILVQVAP